MVFGCHHISATSLFSRHPASVSFKAFHFPLLDVNSDSTHQYQFTSHKRVWLSLWKQLLSVSYGSLSSLCRGALLGLRKERWAFKCYSNLVLDRFTKKRNVTTTQSVWPYRCWIPVSWSHYCTSVSLLVFICSDGEYMYHTRYLESLLEACIIHAPWKRISPLRTIETIFLSIHWAALWEI